jgi:hypothetical protein
VLEAYISGVVGDVYGPWPTLTATLYAAIFFWLGVGGGEKEERKKGKKERREKERGRGRESLGVDRG